ncbi:glycerophosphodiester phosphodiesterase [Kocuria tytonis]|uniref:glycerophosphodiester phosphodiesterase n=1 Tax=Kocuria tytonis TaxID=2054280 RepID=UPI002D774D09|nr:glycerophosphodiester phosphodiesterase family protein [Kocuria tytonis]
MAAPNDRSPARPLVYAHRGSSRRYPELTRAAFVQALADGAGGVECDGHLVLHHDSHLGRTSNGSGPVGQHTLAQLHRLDFSTWKGVWIPPTHGAAHEQLMTLDELLDLLLAAGRPVGLAVETKHPSPFGQGLEEALLVLLMRRGWNPETGWLGSVLVSVMSFHPDAVRYLLECVSPRHVCQLVSQTTVATVRSGLRVGTATAAVCRAGMRLVVPPAVPVISRGEVEIAGPGIEYVRENPRQVEQWLRSGAVLRVWTVDTFADAHVCLALGVQQITTNVPAQVRRWTDPGAAGASAAPHRGSAPTAPVPGTRAPAIPRPAAPLPGTPRSAGRLPGAPVPGDPAPAGAPAASSHRG